jgi:hypothetical protein
VAPSRDVPTNAPDVPQGACKVNQTRATMMIQKSTGNMFQPGDYATLTCNRRPTVNRTKAYTLFCAIHSLDRRMVSEVQEKHSSKSCVAAADSVEGEKQCHATWTRRLHAALLRSIRSVIKTQHLRCRFPDVGHWSLHAGDLTQTSSPRSALAGGRTKIPFGTKMKPHPWEEFEDHL